jgi:hypothetical protein
MERKVRKEVRVDRVARAVRSESDSKLYSIAYYSALY